MDYEEIKTQYPIVIDYWRWMAKAQDPKYGNPRKARQKAEAIFSILTAKAARIALRYQKEYGNRR